MEKFIQLYLVLSFLFFNLVFSYLNHKFRKTEPSVVKKEPSSAALGSVRFILLLAWFVVFILAEGYKLKLFENFINREAILGGLKIVGIILFTLGGLLMLWGRAALGEWFSTRFVVKKGHRLIQEGPYKFVRHPIYVGVLLAMWGLTLALDSLVTLLILAIPFIIVTHLNAKAEERLLSSSLKGEYESYKIRVPMFVPGARKSQLP